MLPQRGERTRCAPKGIHNTSKHLPQINRDRVARCQQKTAMLNKEHGGDVEPLVAFNLSKWVVFAWYSKWVFTIRPWKR